MHSIIQGGLIPGRRSLIRDRQSVFFTAVNPMYVNQDQEEVQYDLDKPRIAFYKHNWRIHQNTKCWCNLKLVQRKGLQFCQTRSHAIALLRKWYTWRLERICTAKCTNPHGYRESYSRGICIMDVRIFPIPKREHPPTIKANKARSTRRLVASISKKLTERSRRKLVAVTLITEFKVYLTQQSRKKTLIARKSQKDWFNSSRRTRTVIFVNRGFEQDWGNQSVQRKVEGVYHQHG